MVQTNIVQEKLKLSLTCLAIKSENVRITITENERTKIVLLILFDVNNMIACLNRK